MLKQTLILLQTLHPYQTPFGSQAGTVHRESSFLLGHQIESSKVLLGTKRLIKDNGIEVSGMAADNSRTAAVIARQVDIDNVLAEVLPEDKASQVEKGAAMAFSSVSVISNALRLRRFKPDLSLKTNQ